MQRAEVEGEEVEDDHRHDAQREDDGEQVHDELDRQPGHLVVERAPAALLRRWRHISAAVRDRLALIHLFESFL